MQTQIILIQPHSVIDVITNSSTELFIANTEKSIEVIRDLIEHVARAMELPNGIGTIEKITAENVNEWIDLIDGYNLPWNVRSKLKSDIDPFPEMDYDSNKSWQERRDEYDLAKQEWDVKFGDVLREALIGMVAIKGESDNTIPYEMFDWIESTFKADRIHLG